jgi:hypothetical protein
MIDPFDEPQPLPVNCPAYIQRRIIDHPAPPQEIHPVHYPSQAERRAIARLAQRVEDLEAEHLRLRNEGQPIPAHSLRLLAYYVEGAYA